MSQANNIKKLITDHQRRVQKLKEQQALKGLNTDPGILIEIEDIEAEIEKLHTELRALERGISEASQQASISFESVTSETSLQQIDKTALRETIATKYSLEQVKTLCEDCGIDYEELGQTGKKPLVRELIREMERRGQLAVLQVKINRK